MDVYNYDPATGAYTSTTAAFPDPLVPGRFLVPANATTVAPPTPGANQIAVFKSGAWSLVANYVGQTWWTAWDASTQIDQIGVSPPAGATSTQPAPPLSVVQQQQIGVLNMSYAASLLVPQAFTTAAGVAGTYTANADTVQKLMQMLLAFGKSQTLPAGFYWVDVSGAEVPMTYADLQGLAEVLGTYGAAQQFELQSLVKQVNAATTAEAVQAITWPQG